MSIFILIFYTEISLPATKIEMQGVKKIETLEVQLFKQVCNTGKYKKNWSNSFQILYKSHRLEN